MAYEIYVIIPVCNAEAFINQAVESVLNQKNKRIKMILIDDGSTDESAKICDKLAAAYSEISVIHQSNGGVSSARNAGIEYVLTQCDDVNEDGYIAFLDADDFWNPQINISEVNAEAADLIIFSSVMCNCAGTKFGQSVIEKTGVEVYEVPNRQWISCGTFGAALYKVSLIRKNHLRFIDGVKLGEDVVFWRQATFCARKVKFCSEILYVYRMNPASATHDRKLNDTLTLHIPHAWERAINWIDALPQYNSIEKSTWKEICSRIVGARLLESVRIMAAEGIPAKRIRTIIEESGLYPYLDMLDVNCLAQWQKSDFILYRKGLEYFAVYHHIRGFLPRVAHSLLRIPFIRTVREKTRFHKTYL